MQLNLYCSEGLQASGAGGEMWISGYSSGQAHAQTSIEDTTQEQPSGGLVWFVLFNDTWSQ